MKTKPKKQDLKVACWNARTMLDLANSSRSESCSALMAHELSRLNIDTAAFSEVHLAVVGSFQHAGAGKQSTDGRLSCVGFMVRNCIASKLETLPTHHSYRIISMSLPLKSNLHLTFFSVCALTLLADTAVKKSFYSDVHRQLNNTPAND